MLSEIQIEELLDRLLDLVPRIRADHQELRGAYYETRPDGYPRASYGDGNGSSGGHSDPTSTAVEQRIDGTTNTRQALHQFTTYLVTAARALEAADSTARNITRPPKKSKLEDDLEACRSCARIDHYSPNVTGKTRLCTFCDGWNREFGTLPNRPALRDHSKGVRITTRHLPTPTPGRRHTRRDPRGTP